MAWTHLNKIQISTLLSLAERRPRDHALLSMSAYTALRIGDVLKLNVADVLDEYGRIKQRITIRQQKTGKPHDVRLPDRLRQSLRGYLDGRLVTDRNEPLFINLDHNARQNRLRGTRRLSAVGAHKLFKKYLAQTLGVPAAELTGLSTHALRRSLAMMIYNEYGLRAAQELLGHTSIGSTGAYLDKLLAEAQAHEFRDQLDFGAPVKAAPPPLPATSPAHPARSGRAAKKPTGRPLKKRPRP